MSGEPDLREPLDTVSRTQPLLTADATEVVDAQVNPLQTSSITLNERPDATDSADAHQSSLQTQASSIDANERHDSSFQGVRPLGQQPQSCQRGDHTQNECRSESAIEHTFDQNKAHVAIEVREEERMCAVCMESRINTVFLPCRHSATCEACATMICDDTNKCPICRARIQQFRLGEFDSSFVDYASAFVERVQVRLGQANASAYENMYENIKYVMLVALVILAVAICVFLYSPFAWVAYGLAGLALLVGYVPWLIVSVKAMETIRDPAEEEEDGVRLLSCDWSSPGRLIFKTLILILLAPFALAVFFVPYGILCIVRSFFRDVLPFLALEFGRFLVFMFCWGILGSEVATRPVRAAVAVVARTSAVCLCTSVLAIGRAIGNGIYACFAGVGRALTCCYQAIKHVIVVAATCVYENILTPIGLCFRAVGRGLLCCLCTCAGGIAVAASRVYEYVLTPVGQGLCSCFMAIGRGIQCCFRTVANGIVAGATGVHMYCLSPIGRCIALCFRVIFNGISACFKAIGRGLWCCLSTCAGGIVVAATRVYEYILTPIGQGLCSCFRAIGHGIQCCFRAIVNGITAAATSLYTYCLSPICQCLYSCLRAAGHAISAIVSAISRAIFAAVSYVGGAIQSCLSACGRSARSIFQSFAQWIIQTCSSIRDSVRSCLRGLRGVRVF